MPDYDRRHIPPKVHRREITARVKRRRTCTEHGVYFPVTWTIPNPSAADFGPRWLADRDFWIAGAVASMDANAGGSDLRINIRRIDLNGNDNAVLASDTRLVIETGFAVDTATDAGPSLDEPDFNILRLLRGERVYPRITQFGTGARLEVTLQLVPVRQAALEWVGV